MNETVKNLRLFKFFLFSMLCFSVLFAGCETKEDVSVPVVGSISLSAITESSVECNCAIVSGGGSLVSLRGFCWSADGHPTINDDVLTDSSGLGDFKQIITELTPGVTYYVRAFATNQVGTSYSDPQTFTTKACLLTTTTPNFILANSAISGGQLVADFDSTSVLAKGVCWNTFPNPTIADSTTKDGLGKGGYTSTMTGLMTLTTYYVRAYITTKAGTTYGNEYHFTTQSGIVALSTEPVNDVTTTSAKFSGHLSGDGGAEVTEYGFVWSTTTLPTISDFRVQSEVINGIFSNTVTGLAPNVTYYVRAYAINLTGTFYGTERTFLTLATLPFVITTAASDITSSSATTGGLVTSDGSSLVTARGIYWSSVNDPEIGQYSTTIDGSGVGSFNSQMTNLQYGTTYYIRAFATNLAGTAVGNLITFRTKAILPTVLTNDVTSLSAFSATLSGRVVNTGGASVDTRGICWSVNQNPTTSDSKIENGSNVGTFPIVLTGLKQGTTYYARAFAVNSLGTAYGNELAITTPDAIIHLTTTTASTISSNSAMLGGSISSVGGASVTSRGVCWSNNPNPTFEDGQMIIASTTDAYSGKVTGLSADTKYYVRAFATNAVGIYYGNEVSFTTLPTSGTVTDIDGNVYHYITIGTQAWMVENLRTTKYVNGTPIDLIKDSAQWVNVSTGAYCEYTNFDNLPGEYGRLYNWYAVNDHRKIAPVGWHVPTSADWNALFAFLGGSSVAGAKLKEAGTSHWTIPNSGATNSTGFTALPTGYRHNGSYYLIGSYGFSWMATETSSSTAGSLEFGYWTSEVIKMDRSKKTGISVRCVRDN